jgi:ssDNA-binding Zn-finger/Zn-ribbon topoisomerase 1
VKRTCSDCGGPLLAKNMAREHFDGKVYTWRCRDCSQARVDKLIEKTLAGFGR